MCANPNTSAPRDARTSSAPQRLGASARSSSLGTCALLGLWPYSGADGVVLRRGGCAMAVAVGDLGAPRGVFADKVVSPLRLLLGDRLDMELKIGFWAAHGRGHLLLAHPNGAEG